TTGSSSSGAGDYTSSFGGTSAAAPIASGAIALVLQANPNLTARDVQHVLIRTARRVQPDDESWALNGAGRWGSDVFGFGAIDAAAAVALAPGFVSRGPERTVASALRSPSLAIPDANLVGVSDAVVIPSNLLVERVQVVLTAPHDKAGDLRVILTSPSGTQSVLADTREDYSPGYASYTLASVRSWDERAAGTWTLRVADTSPGLTGTLASWRLIVIGAPPPCPVDYDASGTRTVADIFSFLSAWFAGLGDFNLDGATAVDDIFAFLSAWFAGCP
ncbi:MAG: proprotein convertase P-domain-containing protein, partial [Thermoleophilia bacterium]|nr:proprotein convertase P-domain-containing protein [Thermoleophilia bacterium]